MFKREDKGKKINRWLVAVLCVLVVVPLIWFSYVKLEGEKPVIDMKGVPGVVPANFGIAGSVTDQKSGIARLWITLLQNGRETVLADEIFPAKGFLKKGGIFRAPISLTVDAKKLNISDGPAKLRVAAWDHSWRDWWRGNQAYIEKEIVFDTRPPVLSVLTTQHNAAQGGSGLVIYKLSEPCLESGVRLGENFFPGYSGYFEDPGIYLAFFAVPFDYDSQSDLYVSAVDLAGNSARSGFYHHIRSRKFKTDTLTISDHFLTWKLPEFQAMEGFPAGKSLVDQFIFINTDLRKRNNQDILANGRKTQNQIFWEGAFSRLPNSAPRAGYGDQRVYQYNGSTIGHAVHMGIDLASLQHAEVSAANRGRVVFAGDAGIYGNLVCLDHGFGLMSIYGHLSRIIVKPDDLVSKGDIIGYTGVTGLAGGDHLHFAMFIDHVFVDPLEWWDATWITNNITRKIEMVRAMAQ